MSYQEMYDKQVKSQNDKMVSDYRASKKPLIDKVARINSTIKNVITRTYPITYIATDGSRKAIKVTTSVNLSYAKGRVSMLSDFENWTDERIFCSSETYGGDPINCKIIYV